MPDILIRGLSKAAVERIDAEAKALGLSRNELLQRELDPLEQTRSDVTLTADDWARSAHAFADLGDPTVMEPAWR